ncbi:MAG TPA: ATP-dependent helicase, partial [Candidatus Paceibacterota bacterium]|nr:ATP-dependent helicase [Candidatus Paceibacterota bacterium]
FGYFEYLEENFLNPDEREENIGELVNFAAGFDTLPELLEKVSLLQATDDEVAAAASGAGGVNRKKAGKRPAPKTEKVSLMTVHLAKGLEFENVFIAGAAEGLLPHIRSIDNEASIEEERRLMYVAMTRAKQKLHITFSGMPSRFISEIPEDCITLAAVPDGDDVAQEDAAREEKVIHLDW